MWTASLISVTLKKSREWMSQWAHLILKVLIATQGQASSTLWLWYNIFSCIKQTLLSCSSEWGITFTDRLQSVLAVVSVRYSRVENDSMELSKLKDKQLVTGGLKFFLSFISPFYHCSLSSEQKAAVVFLQWFSYCAQLCLLVFSFVLLCW